MMRGETLIQQHPPTPPNTSAEYQASLHQIAQYNTGRGFSYGSPRLMARETIPSNGHIESHPGDGIGLGLQYVSISMSLLLMSSPDRVTGWLRSRSNRVLQQQALQRPPSKSMRPISPAARTDRCRMNRHSSRNRLQDRASKRTMDGEQPAVGEQSSRQSRRRKEHPAPVQRQHQKRRSQRPTKGTRPSPRN